MIRLFVAVPVQGEAAEALAIHQRGLAEARWRPLESLHVTLRFCGEVAETTADDLDIELRQVRGRPFDLTFEGVGAFGEGTDIHAIWAGAKAGPVLEALARRCETAARRAGLKPETRAFRPHATLAYLRRPDPARVAAWIQANNILRIPPVRVAAFGLYSSWRTDAGSEYRLEQLYRLSAD